MDRLAQPKTLGRFLRDIDGAKTVDIANNLFAEFVQLFGFRWIWLLHIGSRPGVVNRLYRPITGVFPPIPIAGAQAEENYRSISGILEELLRTDRAVIWNEALKRRTRDHELARRLGVARENGVECGLTVPYRRWDGSTWGITIAGAKNASTDRDAVFAIETAARAYAIAATNLLGAVNVSIKPDAIGRLTKRQIDVARMLGEGQTVAEIAAKLGITVRGVEYLTGEARKRMGSRTTAQLMVDVMGSRPMV